MILMVQLHRLGVDLRLERVVAIAQFREAVRIAAKVNRKRLGGHIGGLRRHLLRHPKPCGSEPAPTLNRSRRLNPRGAPSEPRLWLVCRRFMLSPFRRVPPLEKHRRWGGKVSLGQVHRARQRGGTGADTIAA